jgi:MoaA/NifB/PqqE/SkfB family radical SAM enzyme
MASTAKFRIDVTINNLLNNSPEPAMPLESKGLTLPEPVFPQYPELLADPGPEQPPERRQWGREEIMRKVRGWLVPYMRSRVLPGDFHPIIAYFFTDYKCNLDCWYCWAFDNRTKGMTEDVARRTIDWLHDSGCRVLAFMGGEPLLRPQFVHKAVYYAAKKGFWIYIATNGRLLRPDVADRLGDAGAACFNFAMDAWDLKPGLPKALVPAQKNLEYVLRKQYVHRYMVFFNMNICRNNCEDIRQLTEYAREHRAATDYHINETPMLEQDEHFKHLEENPTYIRPEDWREVDTLVDWIIEKNKAGYQMVNSVQRLREIKAFMRMASGVDLRKTGWNGDGTNAGSDLEKIIAGMDSVVREPSGELHFAEWKCRAGHNNVIIRTDGTLAPCFPMYGATYDWGNIEHPKFETQQLNEMKKSCQRHCFSTLNHNLAYCYNDTRVLKWLWKQARNGFGSGASSFED